MAPRTCPVCGDRPLPLYDGECRRCAYRRLAAPLIAALREASPRATPPELADAVRDVVREALVADAMGAAYGYRERAAEALRVRLPRLSEALRDYPWIARRWPAQRTGRPAADAPEPCPTCGYAPCHPSCPGPQYAVPPEEQ